MDAENNSTKHIELDSLLRNSEDSGTNNNDKVSFFDKLKGIVAMVVCDVNVVVSTSCCQLLERRIPDFELNTMRLITGLVFMTLGLIYRKQLPWIPKSHIVAMLCYCSSTVTLSLCTFVAVTLIPLASAQCITTSSGITSALFIFAVFWTEPITVKRVVFALLCISGVVLVVQPDFIFVKNHQTGNESDIIKLTARVGNGTTEKTDKTQGNSGLVALGYALSIVSGLAVTTNSFLVKKFPFLGEQLLVTGFWTLIVGVIFSAVAMAIFETPVVPRNWLDGLFISGHCFTYAVIFTTGVIGNMYVSGNTVTIMYSMTIVLMLIPQYTVLSSIHPGHRNWMEVVGAFLVLLGSSLGSVLEICSVKLF